MGSHFLSQVIRLVSNLVLTRLLVPEMFGLMAIVTVIIMGVFLLTDVGLRLNVIQSKRAHEETYLDTIWTLGIMRASTLWCFIVLASVGIWVAQQYELMPVGTVYAESMLPWVLPISAIANVINSFEPTWTTISFRNLQQSRLVKIDILVQVISTLLMVVLAYYTRSIWALVAGTIGSSALRSYIVHFVFKERNNRFHLDKTVLSEIFHFGKWIFISSAVGFLATSGDKLLLGGLINTADLGIYNIATFIVAAVATMVSRLLRAVAYPALSETIRNKPYDLKRVYYRFRLPFDAGVLLLTGFFLTAGQSLIDILYDSRYSNAGWMLSLLGLTLLSQRYYLMDECYTAMGKPKYATILKIVRTIALFVMLPIGFYWYGVKGAIWAIVISSYTSMPQAIYFKKKHEILDIKQELITLPLLPVGYLFGLAFVAFTALF